MPKTIGRPPRRDDPQRITVMLPGALRRWLRLEAARQIRDQGDIVSDGLELYRTHRRGRRKT